MLGSIILDPVTMTSSSSLSEIRLIVILSWPATETSWETNPTNDTTRTSSAPAFIVKFPSKSVVVPSVVPLTITVAPGRGPSSLVTTPETDWA